MKEQKQFAWHKFLTISMIVTGVGFFLLSLILPDIIWQDEDFSLDKSEEIRAIGNITDQFADDTVSVHSEEELTRVIAYLERMDKEYVDDDYLEEYVGKIADESPDSSFDEHGELPADLASVGEEHEQSDNPALDLLEEKRIFNLYDYAPEGFDEYVQYDRSLGIEQLSSKFAPRSYSDREKRWFLEFIDQHDPRAWIFYHPYNLNTFVFMGHLIE